jgi:hypothetical protein
MRGQSARVAPSTRRRPAAGRFALSRGALRCRRKFLRLFPDGFRDETYLAWERDYKWGAHERWMSALAPPAFRALLRTGRHAEVAAHADGARIFATGLYEFLHGRGSDEARFTRWCAAVAALPRRQTRVLTWPVVTVFGFIAQPTQHIFLKPRTTVVAAERYGFPFQYASRPGWETYASLRAFAARCRRDTRDLGPRDLIDAQSFIWVQGSDEYAD